MKNLSEVREILKKKKKFELYLAISYAVFAFSIILSVSLVHYYTFSEQKTEQNIKKFKKETFIKQDLVDAFFSDKSDIICAIKENETFNEYLISKNDDNVKNLFVTLMRSFKEIMQLRFIDKDGWEKIRFEREKIGGNIINTPNDKLQNKSNRYYFQETKKLEKNELWNSQIDLNEEFGEVEIPYKPVVRVASKVYLDGEFQGILIANIFCVNFLDSLSESSSYDVYLIDEDGYFIIHPDKKYNFSRYKNTKINAKTYFKKDFESNDIYTYKFNQKFYPIILLF